jgi:hypothetical protein
MVQSGSVPTILTRNQRRITCAYNKAVLGIHLSRVTLVKLYVESVSCGYFVVSLLRARAHRRVQQAFTTVELTLLKQQESVWYSSIRTYSSLARNSKITFTRKTWTSDDG